MHTAATTAEVTSPAAAPEPAPPLTPYRLYLIELVNLNRRVYHGMVGAAVEKTSHLRDDQLLALALAGTDEGRDPRTPMQFEEFMNPPPRAAIRLTIGLPDGTSPLVAAKDLEAALAKLDPSSFPSLVGVKINVDPA